MANTAEVKKNLYSSLKELGLTDLEADLYVASLSLGPSPIATIAARMNISRPNIYKVIAGLEGRGLVAISKKKKYARNFMVEPPTAVLEKLREKRETISDLDETVASALPDLLAMYHQGETPTKIKVLEGKEQFLQTYFTVLDEAKDEALFFGSLADYIGVTSWEEQSEWIKKRYTKGIRIKALLLPSADAEKVKSKDAVELRETRILKGAAPFVTFFQLFANKALVWQPRAPLAVLIEDEYIVAMLKSMFAWMWERSG
jgi:sugar-specific transcriptional regulator TrmB